MQKYKLRAHNSITSPSISDKFTTKMWLLFANTWKHAEANAKHVQEQ